MVGSCIIVHGYVFQDYLPPSPSDRSIRSVCAVVGPRTRRSFRGRLGLCIANLRCWYAEYVYFWISQALTNSEYRGNKYLGSILGLFGNEPGLLGKLDCRYGLFLLTLEEDLGYCAWFLVNKAGFHWGTGSFHLIN